MDARHLADHAGDDGVTVAPPPLVHESVPAPRAGHAWISGYWDWKNEHYVWVPGHWVLARHGCHWRRHRWILREGRWHLEAGGWVLAQRAEAGADGCDEEQ